MACRNRAADGERGAGRRPRAEKPGTRPGPARLSPGLRKYLEGRYGGDPAAAAWLARVG